MSELLPCPFCGSEAHMMYNPRLAPKGAYKAGCKAVCIVLTHWWESEAEAIAAWNRRTGGTVLIDDIEWIISRYFFQIERGQDARLDRINAWLDEVKPLEGTP